MRRAALVALVVCAGCNPPPAPHYRSLTVGNTFALGTYACAVNAADEVYCWDERAAPEVYGFVLPESHTARTPVRVRDLPPVAIVRASNFRTWASTRDAGVYWWGSVPSSPNDAGCSSFCAPRRLEGIGSVSALATSGDTACGLVDTDVWCWGSSAYGELGVLPQGPDNFRWLPPRRVLTGARAVTMAYGRVCATLLDGTVTCWGEGTGAMTALTVPDVTAYSNGCALTGTGTLWCREWPTNPWHGVALLGVREGAFTAGNCVGKGSGEVFCWEWDDRPDGGRTILGVVNPLALAVAPMPRSDACAVVAGGEIRCWSHAPDAGVWTVTGLP